jgi:hypothetical protein
MATNEDGRQPVQYGDQQVERGQGGETHQVAAEDASRLTTQQGTVEDPAAGFRTYPDGQGDQAGPKRRPRAASFADHYSQARQFFVSQTEVEQRHLIDAFVFELSKCGNEAIRARMVAGLRNVGDDLASAVAKGLGLPELPTAISPAREPIGDLPASPALSILANGPDSFAGRKIGILVTSGADAGKLAELKSAAEQKQVSVELVAAAVGGVETSDGSRVPAEPEDRWRSFGSLRRGGRAGLRAGRPGPGHAARRTGLRVRRLRALQVRRVRRRSRAAVRGGRGGRPDGRWIHQPGQALRRGLHRPLRRAALLA